MTNLMVALLVNRLGGVVRISEPELLRGERLTLHYPHTGGLVIGVTGGFNQGPGSRGPRGSEGQGVPGNMNEYLRRRSVAEHRIFSDGFRKMEIVGVPT